MLCSRPLERWSVLNDPLANFQSIFEPRESTSMVGFMEKMSEIGASMPESYTPENVAEMERISRKPYTFTELPECWPLGLVKILHEYIPKQWAKKLEDSKFGFVRTDQTINALAWPRADSIAILGGLPNLVVAGCYSAAPLDLFLIDLDNPLGCDARRIELTRLIKQYHAEFLFGEDFRARVAAFGMCTHLRGELGREYGHERKSVEAVTEETADSVMLFTILHELAHLVHEHPETTGMQAQEQEAQADDNATRIVCSLVEELSWNPFAGALCASLFEFDERIAGISLEETYVNDANETHPRSWQRRMICLDAVIDSYKQGLIPPPSFQLLFAITHSMHTELSNLLGLHGYEPLTSFLGNPATISAFRIGKCPAFLARALPDVRTMECAPFKRAGIAVP
jgi:hypothetical protein